MELYRKSVMATVLTFVTCLPVQAQFYKDKTLTLLINYGAGGNADIEARVFQQHLKKHIPEPAGCGWYKCHEHAGTQCGIEGGRVDAWLFYVRADQLDRR